MRRQTFGRPGRRGTAIAASAAVLCLGGVLAGCGDQAGGDGYVAVGAAGAGPARTPTGAVAPTGKVTLVPLDGKRGGGGGTDPRPGSSAAGGGPEGGSGDAGGAAGGTSGGSAAGGARPTGASGASEGGAGSTGATGSTGSAGSTGSDGGGSGSSGTGGSGGAGSGSPDPAAPSAPGSTAPAGPAALTVSAPVRAAADERWCEKVTVEFRNTGGSPARSGTVTFATHIIGGLGIDWATRESTAPLPVPIGAGAARKMTYTVCVDAWRVPLGMHVETRDVTAVWK
ncbi:hypothetical protein ACIOEW_14160 [Streptomyces sp. NPDC087901]|uniref:hypothetical protein n=1 Tax=unclassified Streptomyces TaxID=2593676 RepID=UPI0034178BB7